MNNVSIMGRLTRDSELKYTPSGVAIYKNSIAVNERKKQNGEWVDHSMFFRVSAFGKTAETLDKYCNKGDRVLLECKLEQSNYTDKEGSKREDVSLFIKSFYFIEQGQKKQSASNESYAQDNTPKPEYKLEQQAYATDDIPF